MKIIANTEFSQRVFDSVDAAAKKFGVDNATITNAIDSGNPINLGIRYWYIDEYPEA